MQHLDFKLLIHISKLITTEHVPSTQHYFNVKCSLSISAEHHQEIWAKGRLCTEHGAGCKSICRWILLLSSNSGERINIFLTKPF